jgi:tetratricopeptide (TPR) repeat protein
MDIDLQLRRGYAFAMAHNLDIEGAAQNAEESFQKALAINSNHHKTNDAYARFLKSTNTWSYRAIPIYEKLINMGPSFALYKKDLASVHTLNSNNEMAIKLLKEYVKLYPQDKEAAKMLNALENGAFEYQTMPCNIKVIRYKNE